MREGGKLEKVTKEGRVWAACVSVIACSHPGVLINLFVGPMAQAAQCRRVCILF